ALGLDLVHGDMVILQSKLDDVRRIINTIVEQAASLTDEVRHQLPDKHRLPTANRTQQSNRRRPRKAAPGHLVQNWNPSRLKSFAPVIISRPLQSMPAARSPSLLSFVMWPVTGTRV